jgi:hypothetical protein
VIVDGKAIQANKIELIYKEEEGRRTKRISHRETNKTVELAHY